MKSSKMLSGFMLLIGVTLSGSALADHGYGGHGGHGGRIGLGLYFGMPYSYNYYPYPYYPYPYNYYPPVVVAPSQPPVYVEQSAPPVTTQQAPSAQDNYYWYHCDKPDGYYPYVKECPSGWQKVTPTPPSQ